MVGVQVLGKTWPVDFIWSVWPPVQIMMTLDAIGTGLTAMTPASGHAARRL